MKVFTLYRIISRPDGTFGVFCDTDVNGLLPFCVSVERPWENNKPNSSCIPTGEYTCVRGTHNLDGHALETFEITNVPGRTGILIHRGNFYTDSLGCVILGERWQPINGINAVQMSGEAFAEFLLKVANETQFKLIIQNI